MGDVRLLEDTFLLEPTDYEYTPGKIVEGKGGVPIHILGQVQGEKFGKADEPTGNNRRYPFKVMESNLKRLQPHIEARGVYGETDHPHDGRTKATRVSHIITSLQMESGGLVSGSWDILDTPSGRIQMAIFRAKGRFGTSSRGTGSTSMGPDGVESVNDDYRLITFDGVLDPASKDAYPKLVGEAKDLANIEEMVFTYEVLKKDYPGLHDELVGEVLREHKEKIQVQVPEGFEGFEQAVEVVRTEFQEKLATQKEDLSLVVMDLLGQYRDQVAEEEKTKLLQSLDPVLDRAALEEISRTLARRGILVPEEYKGKIEDLNTALEEAQGRIDSSQGTIDDQKEQIALLSKLGIQTSSLLVAERKLGGKSYRQAVLDLLGDPAKYKTKEEFERALDSAIAEFQKKEDEQDDLKGQADADTLEKERKEHRDALSRLETQLGEVQEAHTQEVDELKSRQEVESSELKAEVEKWQAKYEEANQRVQKIAGNYETLFADAKRVEREAQEDEEEYEKTIRGLKDRNDELMQKVEAAELKTKIERMLAGRDDADSIRPLALKAETEEEAAEIIRGAVESSGRGTPRTPTLDEHDVPPEATPKGVQEVAVDDDDDDQHPTESAAFMEEMEQLGVNPADILPGADGLTEDTAD